MHTIGLLVFSRNVVSRLFPRAAFLSSTAVTACARYRHMYVAKIGYTAKWVVGPGKRKGERHVRHARSRKTIPAATGRKRRVSKVQARSVSSLAVCGRNEEERKRGGGERVHTRRPWVIVIAFKLSLALMANNIHAVSPSLFSVSLSRCPLAFLYLSSSLSFSGLLVFLFLLLLPSFPIPPFATTVDPRCRL